MTETEPSPEAARSLALRARIDRLALDPGRAGGVFTRLLRPIFRVVGYTPTFEVARVTALFDDPPPGTDPTVATVDPAALEAGFEELETNVLRAERSGTRLPPAHAAWLARVWRALERIRRAGEIGLGVAHGFDRAQLLPPLVVRPAEAKSEWEAAVDAKEAKEAKERDRDEAARETERARRLTELQLAAIDHVMAAAREETRFLARRRRLLEGARRLLLDASASMPLEAAGQLERETALARSIVSVDRLEAAGLGPEVAVAHQARLALRRGDRERLFTALVALDGFARARGSHGQAERLAHAARRVGGAGAVPDGYRSAMTAVFGSAAAQAVDASITTARTRYQAMRADPKGDHELSNLALTYLAPGTEGALTHAIGAVDGWFEVGAALSPARVNEIERHARLVPHPTQHMLLVDARGPEDLQRAIIEDPRRIVLDLAAGRLLARRYVAQEDRTVQRTKLVGEARVYVLDASTSMLTDKTGGSRARVRDAILLAELATTMRRLEAPDRSVRLSLYYRWFTKELGPVTRVATAGEALAAMGEVLSSTRTGGTDIEKALLASFAMIREAKEIDPDLARASVVLVTDGEAPVDPERVRQAREEAGVPVAVSVIALGQENAVLRSLVARQRARGERAFYHFVDDDRLGAVCRGELSDTTRLHPDGAPEDLAAVRTEIEGVLDELGAIERGRPAATRDELAEGAPADAAGQRALAEAAARDARSLGKRFERWFPLPSAPTVGTPMAAAPPLPGDDEADAEAAIVVLATVAEIVGELGGNALARQADAIDVVERLLPDARLSPARWDELVHRHGAHFAAGLAAVHTATRGADAWFDARLQAKRASQPRTWGESPRGPAKPRSRSGGKPT